MVWNTCDVCAESASAVQSIWSPHLSSQLGGARSWLTQTLPHAGRENTATAENQNVHTTDTQQGGESKSTLRWKWSVDYIPCMRCFCWVREEVIVLISLATNICGMYIQKQGNYLTTGVTIVMFFLLFRNGGWVSCRELKIYYGEDTSETLSNQMCSNLRCCYVYNVLMILCSLCVDYWLQIALQNVKEAIKGITAIIVMTHDQVCACV